MTRRALIVLGAFAAVIGLLVWYLYGARRVPAGQPPLAVLSASSLDMLRADFNRHSGATRIIILLSPT